jgi:hypothetical protein
MDRRSFLLRAAGAAVLASTHSSMANLKWMEGNMGENSTIAGFDLVAVKGGEPDVMFLKGMEALGGIKAFVKKGQKVVVKPNIGWDVAP